jgi:two-component system response regulator YcbB
MVKRIITEGELGVVIGEAESGVKGISLILTMQPDIVLVDLLMPELDGIETVEQLKLKGFHGQFIMISQVVNKEMVGEAYQKGVEFFIHKPINKVEVQSVLKKITENFQLKNSLLVIQQSLAQIGLMEKTSNQPSVRDIVFSILNDMGVVGEVGSDDIISIMEFLIKQNDKTSQLPALKDLYEAVAAKADPPFEDLKKEGKAMEQRIRRTILSGIHNLAALGSIDYTNPEFEYYAPRYFDLQEVRNHMLSIREGKNKQTKVKINIKKFLQVLYLETMKKLKN